MERPRSKINLAKEAKYFMDAYGILCVECPRCEGFIPNVLPGQLITCPNCRHEFKVIE